MPGLINTHTHAPMVLFRGLADDLALMDWLQKYIFPAEAKTVSPEFVRAGTRLAALEMIESGTTTYADMYYFEEEIARVTKAAGLRGVLGETIIQFPVAGREDARGEPGARPSAFAKEFAGDELITPAVAPHALYTNDAETLKACRALADRLHIPVIIHLSETKDEMKTSDEKYHATPTALPGVDRLLGAAHAGRARRPRDARRHRDPRAPPRRRGAQPREQHEARERHRAGRGDAQGRHRGRPRHRRRREQQRPRHVRGDAPGGVPAQARGGRSARDSGAAWRSRWRPSTGRGRWAWRRRSARSSPGKRADLLVVSMASARQTPMYDPVSHLVYVTRGDDVRTTIVNGKVLMRDRRVLTLDRRQVLAEANRFADKVRAAVK